jgi:hypothetical protein
MDALHSTELITTLRYAQPAPELRTEAVERLCEENTSHKRDTKPVRTGGDGGPPVCKRRNAKEF